jgi:hypothetical protein
MGTEKYVRKEILLSATTVKKLEQLAAHDKRKLKPYMEILLTDHAMSASQHLPVDPAWEAVKGKMRSAQQKG